MTTYAVARKLGSVVLYLAGCEAGDEFRNHLSPSRYWTQDPKNVQLWKTPGAAQWEIQDMPWSEDAMIVPFQCPHGAGRRTEA